MSDEGCGFRVIRGLNAHDVNLGWFIVGEIISNSISSCELCLTELWMLDSLCCSFSYTALLVLN